jgi:hypothetical protein
VRGDSWDRVEAESAAATLFGHTETDALQFRGQVFFFILLRMR